MKKLLITGSSGFIGRNLVEGLKGRYEVFAPSHAELELLETDAVAAYIVRHNFDAVIHGAVRPGHRNANDPSRQIYCNTRMFFNLARCKGCYGKMFFLGSGAAYGMQHYCAKMPEEYFGVHVPEDEVGFSKYIIGKYIENRADIVDLRVFGIFGKYEDYAIRFISNAICKCLKGLPVTLKQNRKFDYLYVKDFVRIMEELIENDVTARAMNVTPSGPAVELLYIANLVCQLTNNHHTISVGNSGMGLEYSGSNDILLQHIGRFQFTALPDAINELIEWYRSNSSAIDINVLLHDK